MDSVKTLTSPMAPRSRFGIPFVGSAISIFATFPPFYFGTVLREYDKSPVNVGRLKCALLPHLLGVRAYLRRALLRGRFTASLGKGAKRVYIGVHKGGVARS